MSIVGKILSVNISPRVGERKTPVAAATLVAGSGVEGDAHAGHAHRQVSLLASESIAKMVAAGLDVGPGDFAENLTTEGLDLLELPLGAKLTLESGAVLEISQHGKDCDSPCEIFRLAGDCVMPREGVFATVVRGGEVRGGDTITVARTEEAAT